MTAATGTPPPPQRHVIKDALMITAHARGRGHAVLVAGALPDRAGIDAALAALEAEVGARAGALALKLVGSPEAVARATQLLAARGLAPVATAARAAAALPSLEAWFYPDTGRLRLERAATASAPAHATATAAATAATTAPLGRRTRVLVVDDSDTIRRLLARVLGADPDIEVVASTGRPSEVEALVRQHRPDVLTLDIHMPEMDGVTLLRRLLPAHPIPTVMISSLALEEGPMVLAALEAGAVDYIQKPTAGALATVAPLIVERVKTAAQAKVLRRQERRPGRRVAAARSTKGARLIAIGASTGGTEALREVLTAMPAEVPPIVIVQHIPPVFSAAFARRLDELCPFEVKEAEHGDVVCESRALIAPGGKQMRVVRSGAELRIAIDDSPPRNRHKPSVDVLFESVAAEVGAGAVGALLTGMGADGAAGMLQMLRAGAHTIAQDEASSVVYGMPRCAVELGAVRQILDLGAVAEALLHHATLRQPRRVDESA
jgi:two-component system chemotaxis response regulator CheB